MYIRQLLAAFKPDKEPVPGQDSPERGRERYSADDILRLRNAFSAVRQDRDSRCSSMSATALLLMNNIGRVKLDYDLSYADTIFFLDRNGILMPERVLRYALEKSEDENGMVSAAK